MKKGLNETFFLSTIITSQYYYIIKSVQNMTYIEQKVDEHVIIPRDYPSISRVFDLKLINNLTNEMIVYPNVISESKNPHLYCFIINTTELVKGEYTYFIYQKGKSLDTGLLVVGEVEEVEVQSYELEKNIVVYNG